ncbi:MAG: alpha/beta fold hydrolase, partial [Curtobacterium sp.]
VVASVVLVGPVIAAGRRRLPVQALDLGRDGLVEGVRMNAVLVTDYLRSVRQYVPELRPMLRYRLEDTIADVSQPVLVVRGTEDPIARHDWSARVATTARRGALVELPGPHHVQERQPVAFAQLVGEFRRVQTLEGSRPEGLR